MAKNRTGEGIIGTNTGTIIHVKKAKGIRCDCSRCIHIKKAAGTIYCTWFDLFSPKKTFCSRFVGSLPAGKQKAPLKRKNKKKRKKRSQLTQQVNL